MAAKSITGATPLVLESRAGALAGFTNGEGFDAVFDATGSAQAMQAGFAHVAHGGRYVLVSVVRDSIIFSDPEFCAKEMTLMGSRNATSEDFSRVVGAIRDDAIPVDEFITGRTTLAGAVEAIPRWAAENSGLIKAVVEL